MTNQENESQSEEEPLSKKDEEASPETDEMDTIVGQKQDDEKKSQEEK